jgi:hypothetical protein
MCINPHIYVYIYIFIIRINTYFCPKASLRHSNIQTQLQNALQPLMHYYIIYIPFHSCITTTHALIYIYIIYSTRIFDLLDYSILDTWINTHYEI